MYEYLLGYQTGIQLEEQKLLQVIKSHRCVAEEQ